MTEPNPDDGDDEPDAITSEPTAAVDDPDAATDEPGDDADEPAGNAGEPEGDADDPAGEPSEDAGDSEADAGWMDPADDEILEVMTENHVFAPDHIEEEDVCRGPHAAYRCRELAERGLLDRQAIGMYDITELGERYLAGEVDPSDLEVDDE